MEVSAVEAVANQATSPLIRPTADVVGYLAKVGGEGDGLVRHCAVLTHYITCE